MKRHGHQTRPNLQGGLADHHFERLIVFYHDADGLRRGFQFWMGWMGGAQHGCGCVPVYLGHEQPNAGISKILRSRSRKTLVLFSPPPKADDVVELPNSVFTVLAHDATLERCLIVLGKDEATMISFSAPTGRLLKHLFGLGTFAAYPKTAGAGGTGLAGYELQSATSCAGVKCANGKRRQS